MLKSAVFSEPYVCFDLLCIPQDLSNDRLAEICQLELARQAEIFRGARTAVVWLNDISNWGDVEVNITWLVLTYLKAGARPGHYADRLAHLKYVMRRLKLTENSDFRSSGFISDEDGISTGWLSSMWTLQEVIMRPDMVLLTKNWESLLCGDRIAVTFAKLTSLIWEVDVAFEDRPQGAFNLENLIMNTGMMDLWDANRLTPLFLARLGNVPTRVQRPSVMSVIGVTQWHLGREVKQFRKETDNDNNEGLVCGTYPLEFVE
jgi:hypothetical protein